MKQHRPPRRMDTSGVFSLVVEREVWQRDAACVVPDDAPAGRREAMWVAIDEPAASPERLAMLRGLCGSCPVAAECGEFAVRARLPHGFYGGLTAVERGARRRGDDRPHEVLVAHGVLSDGRAGRRDGPVGRPGGDRRSAGFVVSSDAEALAGVGAEVTAGRVAVTPEFDERVTECVARLEALGLHSRASRDTSRNALLRAGHRVSPAVLAAAVQRRHGSATQTARPVVVRTAAAAHGEPVPTVVAPSSERPAAQSTSARARVFVRRDPRHWHAVAEQFAALAGSTFMLPACCSPAPPRTRARLVA